MGFVQRRLLKVVLRVVARPRLTLVIAGVLLAASVGLAWTKLTLSTDQDKLFSKDVPFFKDWLDFNERFPENQALYVLIEAKDPARVPPVKRWTDLADRITDRLRTMPDAVASVDSHVPVEQLKQSRHGLVFDRPHDLKQDFRDAARLGELGQVWGQAPGIERLLMPTPMDRFLVGLQVGPPDDQKAGLAKLLAQGWTDAIAHPEKPLSLGVQVPDLSLEAASEPSDLGYYYELQADDKTRTKHHLLVRIYNKEHPGGLSSNAAPVEAIKTAAREEARAFSEFTVGITGRPAIDADEMRITDRDSNRAESIAMIAVFIGLVVMLRSVWLALAAEICLAVGIGWTFGYATLVVGELNLLSIVFIIALIGIGMDYLVQVLMRYRLEARRYVRPGAVWARVFRYVSPPIFTACFGAAGAFFVSVFTEFRGAADLGIIASGGLLLCLASGYTVLPALLVIFPPKLKPYPPSARYKQPPETRSVPRHLVLPAVWVSLLLIGIPFALRTQFDSNLLDLQPPELESVQLIKKLQTWSAVVMSKDLESLRPVRKAVETAPSVENTESLLDAYDNLQWMREHQGEVPRITWAAPAAVRPADLQRFAGEARALAGHLTGSTAATAPAAAKPQAEDADLRDAAAALKHFADALTTAAAKDSAQAAQRLSAWQVEFTAELRNLHGQLTPPDLDIPAIPPELRSHYLSNDGYYALYINPKHDLWDRANLRQFVKEVEAKVAAAPGHHAATGIAVDVYHTTRGVQKSFYQATFYALALIFLLVLLDLRNLTQTLMAISVLALGLPMLIVLMGLLGVSWNFANFFGLPILIGAGHEYGVFMMHRYKETVHDPRRVWRGWDVSDRALLLCAFVTCSSFGFFWAMSEHIGLKSLGFVMALGSACIYLATIMVLRPLLMLRLESKRRKQEGVGGFEVVADERR